MIKAISDSFKNLSLKSSFLLTLFLLLGVLSSGVFAIPVESDDKRFLDNGDGTITDVEKNIMWTKTDTMNDLKKWCCYQDCLDYVRHLRENNFAGYDDWRLPTVHEASSIFDKEKLNKDFKGSDIHLDSVFPPGAGNCTWTSSTRGNEAQILFYMNGCAYWYGKDDQTISHGVRLVRRDN